MLYFILFFSPLFIFLFGLFLTFPPMPSKLSECETEDEIIEYRNKRKYNLISGLLIIFVGTPLSYALACFVYMM